jgi:dihydroorotate dehydrogenase electron transfer subunit
MFYADILENKLLLGEVYDMRLYAPKEVQKAKAGQFLSLYTGNAALLLPRPLSICAADTVSGVFRVIYRAVGEGTREIATLKPGDRVRLLGPLGSFYRVFPEHKRFALVGGGMGAPPMLALAKKIRKEALDAHISVFLGFRSKFQTILEDDFKKYANEVIVATDDGTQGIKGNAVQALAADPNFDIIYGCGPKIMLKFLAKFAEEREIPCYVSVEEHMACSVGACLACVVKVKDGENWAYRRVCNTGPVFNAKELVWDE